MRKSRDGRWAVIFDLDGTLVDTAPDLTRSLNKVLADIGRPAVAEDTVRHLIGLGARKLIERGLDATGGAAGGAGLDDLLARFLSHYRAHIADYSQPFPGAVKMLNDLRRQGMGLAICTNKSEALARRLLEALDLLDYFPTVIGGDSLARKKPDPAPLLAAITGLGASPCRAVMVGDSETDVRAARAARVPVIAVSFGYTRTAPAALGADAVIDRLEALPKALTRLA